MDLPGETHPIMVPLNGSEDAISSCDGSEDAISSCVPSPRRTASSAVFAICADAAD